MKDRKPPSDKTLFRDAVGDTKPLKQERVQPYRERRRPVPERSLEDNSEAVENLLSDHAQTAEVETGDELLFQRPGLQNKRMRKLRRGEYDIEDELDLHRRTVDQARDDINRFLLEAQNHDCRCVRVIHGKGFGSPGKLPVLKNMVNNWLRQKDEVLAFCSAMPRDGGTGAVYVLLKRKRS